MRVSIGNSGVLCCGLPTTPTTTRSKMLGRARDHVDVPVRDGVVRAGADRGDHGSNSVSRAEPYLREVRTVEARRSPARWRPRSRRRAGRPGRGCARGAARARSCGVVVVGRVQQHEVVGRRARRRARGRRPGRARAPRSRSLSRFALIVRHASRSDSTKTQLSAPRESASMPHRARAGVEVDHARAVDGPDQVERGLAHEVGRRPRVRRPSARRSGGPCGCPAMIRTARA